MSRFVTSPVDPRKLSMLPHQIARQHPGRRQHLHGPIQPMEQPRDPSAKLFVALASAVALFFALQLLRGWL
jgi:hypothetical protein